MTPRLTDAQQPDRTDHQAHDHQAAPSDPALRTKALESVLIGRGLIDPAALDTLIDLYEHQVGPSHGRVRARNINTTGHTRLPRYVRGKQGTIARDHGVFVFNDSRVQGLGDKPQHVYSVRFAARELWGSEAPPNDSVHVDLWDDHLESA